MAKFHKVDKADRDTYLFICPGCDQTHQIWTSEGKQPAPTWNFNGDINNPTCSPSLRIKYHHGELKKDMVCHSIIKGGKLSYCTDCTHELAGKVVDIPDWDEYWKDDE